jgi:hypothetical protein
LIDWILDNSRKDIMELIVAMFKDISAQFKEYYIFCDIFLSEWFVGYFDNNYSFSLESFWIRWLKCV